MAIIPCNQLSLADVFQIARKFMNLTNLLFLSLPQLHIYIDEIIPVSSRKHFYVPTNRSP